jgi:uncharacterized protein
MVERGDTRVNDVGEFEVGLWSNKIFFVLGALPGE